jgi:hypothetical protein
MNAKYRVLWISLFVIALFAGLSVTQAQTGAKADVVTAIFNLENDGVKADLAGDPAFYQKVLAEDWTRGDSDGTNQKSPERDRGRSQPMSDTTSEGTQWAKHRTVESKGDIRSKPLR